MNITLMDQLSMISLSHKITLVRSSSCRTIPCGIVGSEDFNLKYSENTHPVIWFSSYDKDARGYGSLVAIKGFDIAVKNLDFI